jgi:hypothetical protein
MLIAHMDTVYQPGILDTEPYKVDGDRIDGPGIAEDESGITAVLDAPDLEGCHLAWFALILPHCSIRTRRSARSARAS